MFFRDIAGQKTVKDHLIRTVKEGHVSHAQLFAGGEGRGSLLLAVAYAQYLNCLNPGETDSCGVCSSCLKAAKLVHPDIHFVFPVVKEGGRAISDNHIKQWRSFLLQKKYFSIGQWVEHNWGGKKAALIYADESPEILRKLSMKNYEGRYKVMIIWLPERMNDTGANKLLKILEEPPERTVFLLVSESPQNLLSTILSRTQQLNIPPVESESLTRELSDRYGVSIDEARVAARLSGGNFVKAESNLDSANEKNSFFEMFGLLMRSTYSRKIFDIQRWVEMVAPLSRDKIKALIDYSMGMLRESYIYNFGQPDLVYLTSMETDFVKKFSPYITENNIEPMVKELQLAHAHIEQNGNARIVLFDMAIKIVPMFKS